MFAAPAPVEVPVPTETEAAAPASREAYGRVTDEMIACCYAAGRRAYEDHTLRMNELAQEVAAACGVKQSTAFMYIYAVRCMLGGKVYKRAVNTRALRTYFESILADYGRQGLANAIGATEQNVEYRKRQGLPAHAVEGLCAEFRGKL